MSNDGVVFELTQSQFLSLNNKYNKVLKENDLSAESYVFDDFMRDVFAVFLKKLKHDEIDISKVKPAC